MDNQNMVNQAPVVENKPTKGGTILFCIWVIAAVILIQVGVSFIAAIPAAFKAFQAAGGDMTLYQQEYTRIATEGPFLTIAQFVASMVAAIVMVIWYYRGYVKKDKEAGKYESVLPKLKDVNGVFFFVIGTVAVWALACLLQIAAATLFPGQAEMMNNALNLSLGGNVVLGLISAVIFAPVCEEVAVRGIIVQRSKKVFTIVGVAIISAVLFGVFHMNLIQGIYVLPMGLLWGYVAYKYNSVIPTIICHLVNNLIGMTIASYINPDESVVIYVVMFVVLAAIAAFFWTRSNLNKGTEQPAEEA